MPEITNPTSVSMTPELVTKMATRDKYTEGKYCWLATNARRWGSDKGHKMIRVTWQALENPDDVNSVFRLRSDEYVGLPLISDEIADHEPPSFWGETFNRWVTTVLGAEDVPAMPEFVDGKLLYEGEVIDQEDEQEKRNEAILAACEKAIEIWDDDDLIKSIKGCFVYADAKTEGNFTKLSNHSAELKEGETLVPVGQFLAGAVASKSNGATGRAKRAKSKTNGKVTKKRRGRK